MNAGLSKAERQRRLLELVQRNRVQSQQELRDLLAAEAGETTQTTISRDLRELGITKGPDGYVAPEQSLARRSVRRAVDKAVRGRILRAELSGSLVVVHTRPGEAESLGHAIEGLGLTECRGVIAGRDTIFLAAGAAGQARRLRKLLDQRSD